MQKVPVAYGSTVGVNYKDKWGLPCKKYWSLTDYNKQAKGL